MDVTVVVISAAVAVGAVAAGVLGPRLQKHRPTHGRTARDIPAGPTADGAATNPDEARRRSGVRSSGSGPA